MPTAPAINEGATTVLIDRQVMSFVIAMERREMDEQEAGCFLVIGTLSVSLDGEAVQKRCFPIENLTDCNKQLTDH